MSLSLREKQSLYHSLGQLVHSGVPLPGALKSLAQTSSGSQRRLIERLNKAINSGKSLGDAVAAERPDVSELEIGIISACEKSGRMEQGMKQLAAYHGAFAAARERIFKQCAYPAFVLHLSVFMLNVTTIFTNGLPAYLKQVVGTFIVLYGIVLIVFLLVPIFRDMGSANASLDSLLRLVPMFGRIRRAFATGRFCATYEMQLDAGINVIDALQAAQRASMSGAVRAAVKGAIPEVRSGAQVGPLLASSGAFPEPMVRAFCVGEQTGRLDEELARLAADYQEEAFSRLESASAWIGRLIYTAVLCYVGYGIVHAYAAYLNNALKILDGI